MTSVTYADQPAMLEVLQAAARLAEGSACFVVGGALRDQLLGRDAGDIDLAFYGGAPSFARTLASKLEGHFALLDDERGTARVLVDAGPVRTVDVTRLRGDITSDLAERDFTIDALAAQLEPLARGETTSVIDPHGGVRDISSGTIRLVREQALLDDPLRLMRAVRLAVQLTFELESSTAQAIRRRASLISQSAAERIRDEIATAFSTSHAAQAVRLMDSLGLLDVLLPEIAAGRGVSQPKEHFYDVLEHGIETVRVLDVMLAQEAPTDEREHAIHQALWAGLGIAANLRDYLEEELSGSRTRGTLLKLTGLLHDVAKPQTRTIEADGRIRFFGHSDLGAETARSIMRRLRFSNREVDFVATMIEAHLRPGQLGQDGPPTRRALYRFFRDTSEAAEGVLLLSLADGLAARGPGTTLEDWRRSVAYIAHVLSLPYQDETIARPQRLITGNDVMRETGLAPGPEVGRLLGTLAEAQAAGDVSTREDALEYIRATFKHPQALQPASNGPISTRSLLARGGTLAAGASR